jgi:hypothetical protein
LGDEAVHPGAGQLSRPGAQDKVDHPGGRSRSSPRPPWRRAAARRTSAQAR